MSTSNDLINNSYICRLCLTDSFKLIPIFRATEIDTTPVNLSMLITQCTSVMVPYTDTLPKFICTECLAFIKSWQKFRRTSIQSDLVLKRARNVDVEETSKPAAQKVFTTKLSLVRKSFSTSCCNILFHSKTRFRKHTIRYHSGSKSFSCDRCGKDGFSSYETLKRHKDLHTGRFQCQICAKTFTCKAILRTHERDKHENDRPFICDVCGKAFVTQLRLTYHQRFHTGEKKYICEICGTAFFTSSSLTKHRRTHNADRPFKCDLCHKSFIIRSRLVEHIRVHTGDRPYACVFCTKTYTVAAKLKRHLRSHSTQEAVLLETSAFVCDICGFSFSGSDNFQLHRDACSLT